MRLGQQLGADGFLKILPIQVFFVPQKKQKTSTMEIYPKFGGIFDIIMISIPLSKCHPPVPSTLLAAPEGSSLNLRYLVLW